MGLPLEQWCGGGEADGGGGGSEKEAPSGCRTPGNGAKVARGAGESADCPAPPRKRRAAPGVVAQQQRRDYYTGADVEAFFAAHNL